MKTLKDLFLENKNYILPIIEIPDTKYGIWVEGLDEDNCTINGEFDIYKIENILVEIFVMEEENKTYDYVETFNNQVKITEKIQDLIDKSKEYLGG